jgi:hypothetical protein
MELDDLKQRWTELDRKLDTAIRFNTHVLQAALHGKAETALKRLSRWLWIGLGINVIAALWLGWFIANHIEHPRFWLPAVGLHLCVIALIVASIHQLLAISQLDWGAPIVAIQRRLESLRILRIRTTKWTLLLSPLLWVPLLIVLLKGFFDVDTYADFSAAWLAANVLLGVLVIPVALWVSRLYADRLDQSPLLQRLLRDIAGRNLNTATEFLRSLAQFEEEQPQTGPTNV